MKKETMSARAIKERNFKLGSLSEKTRNEIANSPELLSFINALFEITGK